MPPNFADRRILNREKRPVSKRRGMNCRSGTSNDVVEAIDSDFWSSKSRASIISIRSVDGVCDELKFRSLATRQMIVNRRQIPPNESTRIDAVGIRDSALTKHFFLHISHANRGVSSTKANEYCKSKFFCLNTPHHQQQPSGLRS
uniref:Uncharacterized protein n=1 Tax=Romanomermis culicivorax TaxID=13658 RepID=A0A915KPY1_ROMCU